VRHWPSKGEVNVNNPQNPYYPQYPYQQGQPNQQEQQNYQQLQSQPQYPNNPYQQAPIPQQVPQGFPQQQYPNQQMQQFSAQMPAYNRPDATQVMQSYQEHKMSMGRGGSAYNFVKFLGPNNESRWENASVPIGYQSVIRSYLLPPWAPGKYFFAIATSHFWKSVSKPQGASLGCPGAENCKICQVARLAIESPDPVTQKRAKDWGSVNTNFLYQIALLDTPQIHFSNGQAQPSILRAGATLHKAIGNLLEERSVNICDPQLGRPIRIKKTKTGPGKFDVEYSCIDEDPQPLPQQLWGLLNNLIDLESVFKNPTEEEMQNAIMDMGLGNIGGGYIQQPQPYVLQSAVPPMPQSLSNNPNPIPQQVNPMPNLVPPQSINPPPISSTTYSGPQYYPQPSQQNTGTQLMPQSTQQPMNMPQNQNTQQSFTRSPIPSNPNPNNTTSTQQGDSSKMVQQQPMTLQQLQDSIRGNNGK
jgi:hypothetical protein